MNKTEAFTFYTIILSLLVLGASNLSSAELKSSTPAGSCWANTTEPDKTGAFIRYVTPPGYSSLKSCVTISKTGIPNKDREPHMYGGFEFSLQGSNTPFMVDLGLAGQSGNSIANDSTGMIPFIRSSVPSSLSKSGVSMIIDPNGNGNPYQQNDAQNTSPQKVNIYADNDSQFSPFRFHVGDRVCMQLNLTEETYQGKTVARIAMTLDPNLTMSTQLNDKGDPQRQSLSALLQQRYKGDHYDQTESFAKYVASATTFQERIDLGKNHLNPQSTRVRTVVSDATDYNFNGKNIDSCDVEALWQNTQVQRANSSSWESFDSKNQATGNQYCDTDTSRYPADWGKSFTSGNSRLDSLRCNGSSPQLSSYNPLLGLPPTPIACSLPPTAPIPESASDDFQYLMNELQRGKNESAQR